MISGSYGGRCLKSLAGVDTRPTTDKVEEFILNTIGLYFDEETVLDLLAGSGGLAIEAISRDCSHTVCVDKNYQALKIIKGNIEITKESEKFITIELDTDKTIERLATEKQQFDYLFLGPPYAKRKIIDQIHKIEELGFLFKTAVIMCEMDKTVGLPESVAGFHQVRKQTYDIAAVTTYRKEGKR